MRLRSQKCLCLTAAVPNEASKSRRKSKERWKNDERRKERVLEQGWQIARGGGGGGGMSRKTQAYDEEASMKERKSKEERRDTVRGNERRKTEEEEWRGNLCDREEKCMKTGRKKKRMYKRGENVRERTRVHGLVAVYITSDWILNLSPLIPHPSILLGSSLPADICFRDFIFLFTRPWLYSTYVYVHTCVYVCKYPEVCMYVCVRADWAPLHVW